MAPRKPPKYLVELLNRTSVALGESRHGVRMFRIALTDMLALYDERAKGKKHLPGSDAAERIARYRALVAPPDVPPLKGPRAKVVKL